MAASAASPQKRPRSRKSIAHLPPQDSRHRNPGQENFDPAANLTENFAAPTTKADSAKKKSRSKSLGSGGLDALKESSGNRRKVWLSSSWDALFHLQSILWKILIDSNLVCFRWADTKIHLEAHDPSVAFKRDSKSKTSWQRGSIGRCDRPSRQGQRGPQR